MPRSDIAPLLQQGFVALAADCDEPEPEVEALAARLENAMMLPFVMFADSSGRFLSGTSGAVYPQSFKQTLEALRASP